MLSQNALQFTHRATPARQPGANDMDLISLAAVVTFIAGVVACCAAIVCVISRVIR